MTHEEGCQGCGRIDPCGYHYEDCTLLEPGDVLVRRGTEEEVGTYQGRSMFNVENMTFDLTDTGESSPVPCNVCGGEAEYMGSLGRLNWYRCRSCGMLDSRWIKTEDWLDEFEKLLLDASSKLLDARQLASAHEHTADARALTKAWKSVGEILDDVQDTLHGED